MLTKEILQKIYPYAKPANIDKFLPFILEGFKTFKLDTLDRQQMFLAQIGHESGQLKYVEELASGKLYEGRVNLGNTQPGDGVKFKGRGLIQITGRSNYSQLSKDFNVDFISKPELLKSPEYAVKSAFWFWNKNNLNQYCDSKNFEKLTKRINGGLNGYTERQVLLKNAQKYLTEL